MSAVLRQPLLHSTVVALAALATHSALYLAMGVPQTRPAPLNLGTSLAPTCSCLLLIFSRNVLLKRAR